MNKKELIDAVASKTGTSKVEALRQIELVVGTIVEGAQNGECVIPGLGKLVKTATSARSGIAPNGTKWSTPAGNTLKLRLSSAGKDLV